MILFNKSAYVGLTSFVLWMSETVCAIDMTACDWMELVTCLHVAVRCAARYGKTFSYNTTEQTANSQRLEIKHNNMKIQAGFLLFLS